VWQRMVLVGLCLVPASAAGCETICRWLTPQMPTFVEETKPACRILPPHDESVQLTIESVVRGPRGVTLELKLQNQRNNPIQLVSSKVGVRLGSGLRRKPMSFADAVTMSHDYGFYSYGKALTLTAADWSLAQRQIDGDRIRVIEPGQEEVFWLVIGTPPEETLLVLDFHKALHSLVGKEREPKELRQPVAVVVKLPRILPERRWQAG
jgi:hypothetical protein